MKGAKKKSPKTTEMPSVIKPMRAAESKKAFDSPDYLFEFKWDGYRTVATIKDGEANL